MKSFFFSPVLAFVLAVMLNAQDTRPKVRITDMEDRVVTLTHVTTSSSSSCMTADFPVYEGNTKKEVDIGDLQFIFVRRDKPPADDLNYLTVELVKKDGTSGLYEIVRHIRFQGKKGEEDYSIRLGDVKSVRIMN